jgi:hypothetical protein
LAIRPVPGSATVPTSRSRPAISPTRSAPTRSNPSPPRAACHATSCCKASASSCPTSSII